MNLPRRHRPAHHHHHHDRQRRPLRLLLLLAVSFGLLSVATTAAEPALHSDARPIAQPQRTHIVSAHVQGSDLVFTLAANDPLQSPLELLGTPMLRFPGRVGEVAGVQLASLPTGDTGELRLAFPLADLPQHPRYAAILDVRGVIERLPTDTRILASGDVLTLSSGQQFTLAVQEPSTTDDALSFSLTPSSGTSSSVLPSMAYLQQGDTRLDLSSAGAVYGLDLRPMSGSLHFPREQALAMLQHSDTELVVTEYLRVSDDQHRLDLRFTSDTVAPPTPTATSTGTPTPPDPSQPSIVVVTPAATATPIPPIEVRLLTAPDGDVIAYPCSIECPFTVVADGIPAITMADAIAIVEANDIDLPELSIHRGNHTLLFALSGRATIGHRGPSGQWTEGPMNMYLTTGDVLSHVEDRPVWILDYRYRTANLPGGPAGGGPHQTIFVIDIATGSIIFNGGFSP